MLYDETEQQIAYYYFFFGKIISLLTVQKSNYPPGNHHVSHF